jgi:hypothetical protein
VDGGFVDVTNGKRATAHLTPVLSVSFLFAGDREQVVLDQMAVHEKLPAFLTKP